MNAVAVDRVSISSIGWCSGKRTNQFGLRQSITLLAIVFLLDVSVGRAEDYVLTIGGGYSPEGNQVSLEKNVLLFQSMLSEQSAELTRNDIYFADGDAPTKDVLVHDHERLPEANRLMAQVFGRTEALGLTYRNHEIPNVLDASRPETIRAWFRDHGSKMHDGDRLILYVTAHGHRSRDSNREYDTSIAMWDQSALRMTEFAKLLDEMDPKVDVVMVMVQCYTGGFAHLIYKGGIPQNGLSPQKRVGFYATVHDRPAAGCTPEVNEANYEEYSTFFLAALRGIDRMGNRMERPDYNGDARISLEEAHAYVILNADTIDLPVKTSDEYLRVESKFGEGEGDLLRNDESFETVLQYASPVQTVLLKELSEKLGLSGENRIVDARRRPRNDRRRGGPSRRNSETRNRIANDLLNRWPELKNPFNPLVTEMLTTRSEEFINAVKVHPDYKQFRDELAKRTSATSGAVSSVHYERFLRVTDSVVLAENLRRLKNPSKITAYEAIVAAEQETLLSP
jgi:hypothetical protein